MLVDTGIWFAERASGLPVESIAIALTLLLNAGLGVYQESKSEAALAKLREMTAPLVWMMRDGVNDAPALMGLHDETGAILSPLTAVQLLWANIITDGALALGVDRTFGVMHERPRNPKSLLLDPASLKFILVSGCALAMLGGALMLAMSRLGFTLSQTRTAIFCTRQSGNCFTPIPRVASIHRPDSTARCIWRSPWA